tara:strand:- start:941 stop:1339 length:399 start_codon:yes stop_codon:yes gene_type:complete
MIIKPSQVLVEEAKKEIESIDAKKAKKMLDNDEITLIDIRDIRELWRDGTVKNSIHIPRGMLEFWLDPQSSYYKEKKINNSKKMVLYCALGQRSALATKTLKEMGFENVAEISGGFEEIKKANFEIIEKIKK